MENSNEQVWNISQVAKMFKVATSLIRYWETEFDILQPTKDEKGNRLYNKKDVDHLRIVYHLVKEKGYTLAGAKKALAEQGSTIEQNVDAIETLKSIRTLLVEMKKKLNE